MKWIDLVAKHFFPIFRYFDCIDICKVRSGWNEVRLQGTLQPLCTLSCVLLTVLEPTEAEFTLFQEGQRNSEKSQRSQLDLCVVIFRTRSPANPEVGRLVEHSKRQVSGIETATCDVLLKFHFDVSRYADSSAVTKCWNVIYICWSV